MFARIGTWEGTAEELEKWILRGREQVKPNILKDPGLNAMNRGIEATSTSCASTVAARP